MQTLRRVSLIACSIALLFGGNTALAQTGGTGALSATVTDPTGAVIAGAIVTISRPDTGLTRTQTTEATGTLTFTLLPPGDYHVSFSAPGFNKAEVGPVTV